ncbi:hypothetical protein ACFIQF_17725, partial [Comamonas sp. J-3]|uniref:hypothetical protein n=1 Tax=Comamonas trifloxystrobinivorans TaxID=3350256 RepID=UPI00372C03F5
MKLHFESDLPYQAAAIEAVCDLFRGQEVCRSVFTVTGRCCINRFQAKLPQTPAVAMPRLPSE